MEWSQILCVLGKIHRGTGILVAERLIPFIEHHGVLVSSKAQFFMLCFSKTTTIGIINLYGYNQPLACTRMWNTLTQANLPQAEWLWGGEWNMVKEEADRSTLFIGTAMARLERGAGSAMLMLHGLTDIYTSDEFDKSTPKHFTWQGNRRGQPIFSRIDRFYASQSLRKLGGTRGHGQH